MFVLKRSIKSLLVYIAFITVWTFQISRTDGVFFIIYVIADFVFAFQLLWLIFNRDYITVSENKVSIKENVFVTKTFKRSDIQSIFLEYKLFQRSHFELTDGSIIKFSIGDFSETEIKKLKMICEKVE